MRAMVADLVVWLRLYWVASGMRRLGSLPSQWPLGTESARLVIPRRRNFNNLFEVPVLFSWR